MQTYIITILPQSTPTSRAHKIEVQADNYFVEEGTATFYIEFEPGNPANVASFYIGNAETFSITSQFVTASNTELAPQPLKAPAVTQVASEQASRVTGELVDLEAAMDRFKNQFAATMSQDTDEPAEEVEETYQDRPSISEPYDGDEPAGEDLFSDVDDSTPEYGSGEERQEDVIGTSELIFDAVIRILNAVEASERRQHQAAQAAYGRVVNWRNMLAI